MNIKQVDSTGTDRPLRTILLVDDSPVNLGVVVEGLESHGYEVLVALDGKEALQRVEVANPDLILLDVMMPGMDGFEVCRKLKAHERTRDIPVIFMTALNDIQDKVKGFDAGAVDYIAKPLQIEEVRMRINVHLELRALRQTLEKNNSKLQFEMAEREKAEETLSVKVEQVSGLNLHLEKQAEELKASREQLRLTEAWYRGILRSAPDGMAVVNTQGRIVLANESLESMFGYAEGELLDQPMEILLPPEIRSGHVAKREVFFASGVKGRPMDSLVYGLRASRRDGSEFPVDVSLSPLPDMGAVCVAVRDITKRKKMEDELHEKQELLNEVQREQIKQRYQGMVNSRLEKSAKLEAVGTLAAGIAHDFNNLLGSIVGFAEMAGDELPVDSVGKYSIEQVLIASFRARDIVARMLTFARQGADKPAVEVELVAQIRETIALLSISYKPDLDFRFYTDIEQATVMADPGHLQQIVMNLCINAADAMNHKGVVVVRIDPVTLDGDTPVGGKPGICLTVADRGHGISAAVQARIFDPFFTTKAPNKGSGLGLSVVYGIVTQLGGVISLQSRTRGSHCGTEFSVLLPLAEQVVAVE